MRWLARGSTRPKAQGNKIEEKTMHFSLLVITSEKPDEAKLAELMAPFCQTPMPDRVLSAGELHDNERKWDWYQLGGRWTGHFDGYDPETDPANIEVCKWCVGTGKRDDAVGCQMRADNPEYSCNGCQGKGKCVKWPTSWAPYAGDQIQVKDLKQPIKPTFATLRNGGWVEPNEHWAKSPEEELVQHEEFEALIKSLPPETWLTIVDYHS